MATRVAEETSLRGPDLFSETQRRVRGYYQWMLVHDFLPRIVGAQRVEQLIPAAATAAQVRSNLQFFHWQKAPFMPVEFSVAAYRFGHSMIRFDYTINDVVQDVPVFSDSTDPLANHPFVKRLHEARCRSFV